MTLLQKFSDIYYVFITKIDDLTIDDNVLYLFNNTLNSIAQAAQHCSGHALFINKMITIDTAVTLSFGTQTGIVSGTFGYGN